MKALTMFIVVAGVGAAVSLADFDVIPTSWARATTEIHGVPFAGSAWVENNYLVDYPFDESVVELVESTEVDEPPASNIVSMVGGITSLGEFGQRIHVSFFGPNATDNAPDDDLPIFVDLYGTYTDSNSWEGPLTGPVDLFDVGLSCLHWDGVEDASIWVDPTTAGATIVNTDGSAVELALGEHPFVAQQDSGLAVSLYSAAYEPWTPWVPDLLADADEVHIVFDVYIPEPATMATLGAAGLITLSLRRTR